MVQIQKKYAGSHPELLYMGVTDAISISDYPCCLLNKNNMLHVFLLGCFLGNFAFSYQKRFNYTVIVVYSFIETNYYLNYICKFLIN